MTLENTQIDEKKIPENQVVVCLTCAIAQAGEADIVEAVWNNAAWNVSRIEEEEEAFLHSKENPHHIMLRGLDWGYQVNGC